MDFQDYVSKEAAATLGRALAESAESSRQRLQSFRSAINAATKALETALAASPPVDVADLAARLAKAARAESDAAAQRAAAEANEAADRRLAEAKAAADAVSAQLKAEVNKLKAEVKDKAAIADSLVAARAQADELRLAVHTEKEHVETARRELAAAVEAQKQAEAVRAEAVAEREKAIRARATAESDLEKADAAVEKMRADVGKVLAEADRARTEADKMREESTTIVKALDTAKADKAKLEDALNAALSQTQAAEAKLAAVTSLFKTSATKVKTLERADADREATIHTLEEQLAAARAVVDEKLVAIKELETRLASAAGARSDPAEVDAASAVVMETLLGGFRALANASTIAEVLSTMVKGLSKEFSRVALFRVKGNRLEGQEHVGFDAKTDIAKVVMPLGMDSLLSRSVNSGAIERLTGEDVADMSGAPFGGRPTCAVALPVVVHGETLGIVYADNAGSAGSDSPSTHDLQTRFAEALLQHGVSVLTRLTTELRTLAELRAYAGSLLSEMEQMYLSDVNAGKAGTELQKRLRENLDYARSIYANRIAIECPDAGSLLDDQVALLVESQQDTAFGRDLGTVAGQAPESASRRTAS